jgi:hypothetical protein
MANRRHRSPAYPSLSLKDAIERARTFFAHEGKHEATIATTAAHWGYSPTSSSRLTTVAALKAYGLMEDRGEGDDRKVSLSPLGLRIVQDRRMLSPERDAAIRQAAVLPKAMADLWSKYGLELPSDDTLAHYLEVERGFNPNAVRDVIRIYKENIAFAGLGAESATENDGGDENEPADAVTEQSSGRNERSTADSPPPPVAAAVAISAPADEEIANIRVSRDCTIRLLATGPYSRKSIEALVAQLELGLKLGTYDDQPENDY